MPRDCSALAFMLMSWKAREDYQRVIVAHLPVGQGVFPELELISRQQRSIPPEKTAALEGDIYDTKSLLRSLPVCCSG